MCVQCEVLRVELCGQDPSGDVPARPFLLPMAADATCLQPGEEACRHHGDDEQHARDDVDDVAGHSGQAQGAAEGADEQHAGDDAVQGAAAAEDRDAAEQHGRDDLQLHAHRVVAARVAVQEREVDAREARDRAAQHEEDELRAADVDARELRGLLVQADRVQRSAERGEVQQHGEDDRQDRERDHDHRDRRARDVRLREVGPQLGEVGDRRRAEQPDRDAAEQRERADRDRERGQPHDRHEEAVDHSARARRRGSR